MLILNPPIAKSKSNLNQISSSDYDLHKDRMIVKTDVNGKVRYTQIKNGLNEDITTIADVAGTTETTYNHVQHFLYWKDADSLNNFKGFYLGTDLRPKQRVGNLYETSYK